MKFIKSVLATVAMTTAFMASAQATTSSFTLPTSIDSNVLVVSPGTFKDSYIFNVTQTGAITFSVTEIENSLLNIDFLGYGLYNSAKNQVTNFSNLSTGIYTLFVSGETSGSLGGAYNLKVNLSAVTAVPEPETNALMLVGLGLIGFIARRKFA